MCGLEVVILTDVGNYLISDKQLTETSELQQRLMEARCVTFKICSSWHAIGKFVSVIARRGVV